MTDVRFVRCDGQARVRLEIDTLEPANLRLDIVPDTGLILWQKGLDGWEVLYSADWHARRVDLWE